MLKFNARSRRTRQRTKISKFVRAPKLRLEGLEDRTTPSVNIPLNGFGWTPLGPAPGVNGSTPGNLNVNGRLSGVSADPTDSNRIFVAAAGGGVARTLDGGVTWQHLTDNIPGLNESQRAMFMGSVAVDQNNPNVIFAGEGELNFSGDSYYGRGILRSLDGGNTWSLNQGPTNDFDQTGIPKIVIAPHAANLPVNQITVFAVVTSSVLVPGLPPFPATANGATGSGTNAVWRSDDGGTTWTSITDRLNMTVIAGGNGVNKSLSLTDFVIDPSNPNVAYVAVGNPVADGANGLYRTTHALDAVPALTTTWTVAFGGTGNAFVPGSSLGRINVAIAPTQPNVLFAVADNQVLFPPTFPIVQAFRSLDSGITWTVYQPPVNGFLNFAPTQRSYNMAVAISPVILPGGQIQVYMAGTPGGGPAGNNVIYSGDTGNTWTAMGVGADGNGPHVDCHAEAFDASGRLLLGCDGGIFRLNSVSPINWTSLNGVPGPNSLNVMEFVGIAQHPFDAEHVIGGTQDNGTNLFVDNGLLPIDPKYGWTKTDGGDGGDVLYDFINPQVLYRISPVGSFGQANYVRRSADGGLTWTSITTGIVNPPGAVFYPPLIMDPSNHDRLLTATDQVSETLNDGTNWAGPYWASFPDGPIQTIAVGRFNGNVVYAASQAGTIRVNGVDPATGQLAWLDITPPGFTGFAEKIAVDPNDSDIVYVISNNFNGSSGKIFRSTNRGSSWTDLTRNLPNLPAHSVALDPQLLVGPADDDVYIGMDTGIWKLKNPTDPTSLWARVGGTTLPNALVSDIEVNTGTGVLAIATYGRGVWEMQIRPYVSGYKYEDINGDAVRNFIDSNGNGSHDPTEVYTEPGVAGWVIEAVNTTTNTVQASTVTDANGHWEFRALPDGNYRFIEVGQPAWQQTTANPPATDIDPTKTITNFDFGNFRLTSITGEKYEDHNGNGVKDSGDQGLNGWTIRLERSDMPTGTPQALIAQTVTATDPTFGPGYYHFDNLAPFRVALGATLIPYRIVEVLQNGWVQTSAAPVLITLTSNTPTTGVDIGNFKKTSITVTKFEDINGSGVREAGEPLLNGWHIQLINAATNAVIDDEVTGTNGNPLGTYTFNNLAPLQIPGNGVAYRIREVSQTGWTRTTALPADITLSSGVPVTNVTFGNFRNTTITVTKFHDHNGDGVQQVGDEPLNGWHIQLINAQTGAVLDDEITGTNGNPAGTYTFTNLAPLQIPGNTIPYRVRETFVGNPGWVQTSAQPNDILLSSNTPVTGVNFGNFQLTTISGQKFEDHDGNGNQDAGVPDQGLAGWHIQLINSLTLAVVDEQITDTNGNYTFSNVGPLQNGGLGGPVIPYRIREVLQTHWTQTTPNLADFTVNSGVAVTAQNIGNFHLFNIFGQKYEDLRGNGQLDSGDKPLPGWTFNLVNQVNNTVVKSATTDANGLFEIPDVGPGHFKVVEVQQAGWVQTSPSLPDFFGNSGVDVTGQAFGNFKLINITGRKIEDLNGDGLPQGNEPGVQGWTIQLFDTATNVVVRTATTNPNGDYILPLVGPGTFRIREVQQPGWVQTSINPFDITTRSGVDQPGFDFTNFHRITISGRKYNDVNGNGQPDASDAGLGGWTIQLLNPTNGAVIDSRVTAADGSYTFTNVGPGKVRLREVAQAGWIQTSGNPADITPVSSHNVTGQQFGNFKLATIAGLKFNDLNGNGRFDLGEPGLPGVTIIVRNASTGTEFGRAVTDSTGNYAVKNLPPGTYATVEVTPGGYQQTSPAPATITPTSGQTVGGVNFANATLATISGHAYQDVGHNGRRDPGDLNRANIGVQLVNSAGAVVLTTFTDSLGNFIFRNIAAGQYQVRAVGLPAGFTITQPLNPTLYTINPVLGRANPANVISGLEFGVIGKQLYVTGADVTGGSHVKAFDPTTGAVKFSFYAYNANYTGGVRVASADVNGDGFDDIITATGIGGGPHVKVFDGVTGAEIRSFYAYDPSFSLGVYVAAADVNGDGFADIITGAGQGGGPHVKVFDGKTGAEIRSFFAYNPAFAGGVRVAAADINGDGFPDIITGAGPGGGPHVQVFDGQNIQLIRSFFAFDPSFSAGIFVAAGDLNGDGAPEIIVGPGQQGIQPHAHVFDASGTRILLDFDSFPPTTNLVTNELFASEVRVGVADVNNDGRLDIVLGAGPGSKPRVRFVDGSTGNAINEIFAYDPSFLGGLYVS